MSQNELHILIVEDEPAIRNLILFNLEDAGYICTIAEDGLIAANILENQTFDLILLDIMLPKIDGYELLEYIRPTQIPVIFLTAKGALNDKVKGLSLGAEDYIVKPFEIVELLTRIKVVLRRYNKTGRILHFEDITLDPDNQTVKKSGKAIVLTPKEYQLLALFMQNVNITLFRDKIFETVWETEYTDDTRTLDLHIQRLRKKTGLGEKIRTVYGVGYRLEHTTT